MGKQVSEVKVSVVMPICNAESYLEQCITSVMEQTLQNIEIICVDDGSKDASLSMIEKFAKQDSRIKIVAKKNTGYGNSVNCGIAVATGQYIGIVESDDFVASNMYEALWNLTEDGTVDMVKGNFWDYYDWPNKPAVPVTNCERKNMPDVERAFTVREYPDILWGHPSVWSGIYRSKFLKKNNIVFMEVPGGGWVDNPFFFETLCTAKSIKWTKEPFYYYRKTNMESSSNRQSDLTLPLRRMMDNLDVLEKHNYCDKDIQKFAYARALMYLCGVLQERHYDKQIDRVLPYAQKLMERLNPDVITQEFHMGDQQTYHKYLSPLQTLLPTRGRVLIYNWAPFDNPGNVGGGVTTYCYNLIATILRERPDIEVYFISSGWAYDASTTECFVRQLPNVFGTRCRSYEIVNSPVPAAQDMILNNPRLAFENTRLKEVFNQFIKDYGTFDAVHFNNIEGISLDVLQLKEAYPNTHFVYSIHNYVPFCVSGFYYQRDKHCNCNPNHSEKECSACMSKTRNSNVASKMYARGQYRIPEDRQIPAQTWLKAFRFDELDDIGPEEDQVEFCRRAVEILNQNMDSVLAVSERVYEIARDNGMDESKMSVSYIGTRIAAHQIHTAIAPKKSIFKVAFLGANFNFEEKGYPFLMKALESMEEKDASRIELLLTTTNGDEQAMKNRLSKFHSVTVKKGYTHRELKSMLKDVNLGVVPVLWEDNLPQISIEMVAMGVPVLCSSFGGASELCDNALFRFKGGNQEDFIKHLLCFVDHPEKVDAYWEGHNRLVTMQEHWEQLESIFGIPKQENITISVKQYGQLLDENEFISKYSPAAAQRNIEYQRELSDIRSSMSYRVGVFITFIPRKIRGLMLCFKENGLGYTVNRFKEHLTGKA